MMLPETKGPNASMRHRIVYFEKDVVYAYHFFEILPQLRVLEINHHLISPWMYKPNEIEMRNEYLSKKNLNSGFDVK